jgi:dipeptidyl aminopeptidase/acylaminoacyl peptidase
MSKFFFVVFTFFHLQAVGQELSNIKSVDSVHSCFRGPFESYEAWTSLLTQKKPGFSIENFPFSKDKFEFFKSTLACKTFNYNVDGITVQGFAIYPSNSEMPLPTVIYNRGGNSHYGRVNFGKMMFELMPLASEGFFVIGSQYRWSGKRVKAEDYIANNEEDQFGGVDVNDVLSLVPIIRQLKMADVNRLGVYGGSRGGMQSYLFAKQYPDIKAVVVKAGISDLFSFRDRDEKTSLLLSKLIPNYENNERSLLEQRSALYWADELPKVPTLLIHAKDDRRVDYANSERLAEAFNKHSVPHKLMTFESGGHNLTEHRKVVASAILSWFKDNL